MGSPFISCLIYYLYLKYSLYLPSLPYFLYILFYRSGFLLLLLLLLLIFFRTILFLCIKSEIMDGFWSSRCLNDRIDLLDKIGSFLSGSTTPMVVKNGTKKIIPLPMIKLSISQPFEELQG